MTTVKELHEQAMTLAEQAFLSRHRDGDEERAAALDAQALPLEAQAARMVPTGNERTEPTRSVLFRSAASLAWGAKQYQEALALIAEAFQGSTPPAEIAAELEELREVVEQAIAANAGRRRIIFLDIDGVLVNLEALKAGGGQFSPGCVGQLNRLLHESGAEIVVSSVWRRRGLREIAQVLRRQGVQGRVVGITPSLNRVSRADHVIRGEEILAWLAENPEVQTFVILDDDADMGDLLPCLVQTDSHAGLTPADVDRALILFAACATGPENTLIEPIAVRLTPGQRRALERMAEGAELTMATPGGWWLETKRVDGRVAWALLRNALISADSFSSDTYSVYSINERGRQALAGPAASS